MTKRDIKKELADLYRPSAKKVVPVTVPEMNFLMIDGEGDPNTSASYGDAVEALIALAYALRFAVKRGPLQIDFGVMPLEGLWWADDMSAFAAGERSGWKWTMMIMQPEFIGADLVDETRAAVAKKKRLSAIDALRFEPFAEGLCAQVMHVGPFADEAPTIDAVHEFIEQSAHERRGKHHEIYLTDIRRADPAGWRTIIRQPMQ